MNAVGIICEYNPLHNGHVYHIRESKKRTAAAAVVCAMSGDFVQRGEPAVCNKWERTAAALYNGVDVVFEIPVFYCLGNASSYAVAGVSILEAFGGATHISFGSESGSLEELSRIAYNLTASADELTQLIKLKTREGLSYPKAREYAYAEIHAGSKTLPDEIAAMRRPNNILALEYMKAIRALKPVTFKREGADYDDSEPSGGGFQSAAFIRRELACGRDVSPHVPSGSLPDKLCLYGGRWFDAIRYKILTLESSRIEDAPHGGEGIGNRLKAAAVRAVDVNDLVLRTKSKRYTYTHVARLIVEVLLGITRDMGIPDRPPYLRVLGCTENGRKLLSTVKRSEKNSVPIITNINKEWDRSDGEVSRCLELDIMAGDIYNLLNGNDIAAWSDRSVSPVIV